MIESLIRIGERVLNDDFSKKNILKHISIIPETEEEIKTKEKGTEKKEVIELHPIIIDFNTENRTFEIRRGPQFSNDKDYFILKKSSPQGEKIAFNTDNISYHLCNNNITINGVLNTINKYKDKIESSDKFKTVLKELKNFYLEAKITKNGKKKKGYLLNPFLLNKRDKGEFIDILLKNINSKHKTEISTSEINEEFIKENSEEIKKAYLELRNKKLDKSSKARKKYAFIYINGKNIFNSEFAEDYTNLCYYAYVHKVFLDEGKKDKICYFCGKKTTVTNNVKTPFKIYITDKEGFFQNYSKKNAYKSFSLCEDCYVKLLAGINYALRNFNSYIFGTNFLVIPKGDLFFENFEENQQYLNKLINLKSNWNELRNIAGKSIKYNYLVDFLFYENNQSAFKVLKYISDVELKYLIEIKELLEEINSQIYETFNNERLNISLNTLYEVFVSNNKDKSESILLDFLESLYNKIPLDSTQYFELFLKNYKQTYYKNKDTYNIAQKSQKHTQKLQNYKNKDTYNIAIKALYFLELLLKLKLIEVNKMEINTFSGIEDEDLKKFFEKHEEIDSLRAGFVALGYLINKIIYVQEKEKKSSTFISKIDFDGFDKIELIELLNEIEEYYKIYKDKIYVKPSLKTYAFETISKYIHEDLKINPAEITFYILLGINLGKLIGIKNSEKNKGDKNGE